MGNWLGILSLGEIEKLVKLLDNSRCRWAVVAEILGLPIIPFRHGFDQSGSRIHRNGPQLATRDNHGVTGAVCRGYAAGDHDDPLEANELAVMIPRLVLHQR